MTAPEVISENAEVAEPQAIAEENKSSAVEASTPVLNGISLEDTFDKSGKAFAELRIKNKRLEDMAMRFANMAGIKAESVEEAVSQLTGVLTASEAKSKNLDPIILKTLQEQQAKLEVYEQEEIKKEANASFQELQKTFNLDTKDLTSFANQLSTAGVNPFQTRGVNLKQQYLELNYTKLIERAREQGRREEAERQKRVAQSSTPGSQTGATAAQKAASTAPIDGFAELARILGINK
jgi:hypothetical protein